MTDALGWLGTMLIVGAYAANSWGRLKTGLVYQALNLYGAVCVGANVWDKGAWPALALQITWGGIAIASLLRPPAKPADPADEPTSGTT